MQMHSNVAPWRLRTWLNSWRDQDLAFKWHSWLAGGHLSRCLRKCHQSLGQSVKHHAPFQRFPSGRREDRSSWLDPADNSKLFALRNDSAGLGRSFGFWLREMSLKVWITQESGMSFTCGTALKARGSHFSRSKSNLLTKIMQHVEGQLGPWRHLFQKWCSLKKN